MLDGMPKIEGSTMVEKRNIKAYSRRGASSGAKKGRTLLRAIITGHATRAGHGIVFMEHALY